MRNIIKAPMGASYLGEFMKELPKGIFNKKQTDVGATTLVLESPTNSIVVLPNTEGIINKIGQKSKFPLFGIYAGITNSDFREYIRNNELHHLMVTYDSLPKLIRWLSALDIDAFSYTLLIDEYHLLLSVMSYRSEAVINLVAQIDKFSHYTLMSATPIKNDFIPSALKEMDYTEIDWPNPVKFIPAKVHTSNPFAVAAKIAKLYKANGGFDFVVNGNRHKSYEALFFTNTVKGIKAIINAANLSPSEVKIICKDNIRNREIIGKEFDIVSSLAPNKMFTFITSKSFQAADFFSDTGVSFVVSDAKRKHTLADIETELFQIAGRIRTKSNPFRTKLFHIYSTGYVTQNKEQFKKQQTERITRSKFFMNDLNSKSKEEREMYSEMVKLAMDLPSTYLNYNKELDKYEYNELKERYAEYAFNLNSIIYKSGLSLNTAYKQAGIESTVATLALTKDEDTDFINRITTSSFKELLIQYIELRDEELFTDNSEIVSQYEKDYPIFKRVYNELTPSQIATSNYVEKSLLSMLHSKSAVVLNLFKQKLYCKFNLHQFYSLKEAKKMLNGINKEVNSNTIAKATDLEKYFDVNYTSSRKTGRKVDGLELNRIKWQMEIFFTS